MRHKYVKYVHRELPYPPTSSDEEDNGWIAWLSGMLFVAVLFGGYHIVTDPINAWAEGYKLNGKAALIRAEKCSLE